MYRHHAKISPTCWFAMLIVLVTGRVAMAQSVKDIAKNSFPSVVLVTMEDANRQPLCLGSGFFVAEGVIATNYHVIEGAASGRVKLIGQKDSFPIKGTVGVDQRHDLVLLAVDHKAAPALSVADDHTVEVGEKVYAVGNPRGLEGTFSEGIVSGIRDVEKDRLIQITAPISPGSSGGPVLGEKGTVIGVAVATLKSGQNLNFAIPVAALRQMLEKQTAVAALKPDKSKTAEKSFLAEFGGNSREGVTVGAFDWEGQYDWESKFTVSVRNHLEQPLRNVIILVIFYDKSNEPLDVQVLACPDVIPAGLARRAGGHVDKSVKRLTTPFKDSTRVGYVQAPTTKLEFRVLDFAFAE